MAQPRSGSAQSRSAWDDPRGQRPEEMAPSAMQTEMFMEEPASQKSRKKAAETKEEEKGCGYSVVRGIRSIWATRMTEDTDEDRELYVKTTLRELIIYIVFLIILCILTFGMTSTTMYYYTKVMSELFLDAPFSDTKNNFRGQTTIEDFWRFALKDPMLDGLYWEKWYNDDPVREIGYIFFENKLLGVPRLRQLKVRNDSCVVHEDFRKEINFCYDEYHASVEDTSCFGPCDNETAWHYQTSDTLDGSNHYGNLATYNGGGYVMELATTKVKTRKIMAYLMRNLWIDRGTRVMFLDFTVYNANINLFCVVRLVIEYPPTGGAIPSWSFRTVKLLRYVSTMDYFVLACEILFTGFIIYYIIEEILEIRKHRLRYFLSFWNILDIAVIGIALVCIAFNVYRQVKVTGMMEGLLSTPNKFPDFEFLSYWQTQFNNAIAIAVFFSWVKLFKYISFNKTMTQLSSTLGHCAKDLAGFAVMFFIIFFAFAQLGYLIFGTQVRDFSTFWNAVFTLFRIILGDFDFHELESAHRLLGPIYFVIYVFFVFFVLLNMFLAIINDTYSEVKSDLAQQENEFEMGDYLKQSYGNVLTKLKIKKERITDIQGALAEADDNNDKNIDFEEWRQDLKHRGYAEAEIEAVFAKYDMDGDRELDLEEQRRMKADLEKQKVALNREYDDLEGARPLSGLSSGPDDNSVGGSSSMPSNQSANALKKYGISNEEFKVLARRVDRMEHSVGSIVSKIDAVLLKLEAMEQAKEQRKHSMSKALDKITESSGSDRQKRQQMEHLVKEELEKWDQKEKY